MEKLPECLASGNIHLDKVLIDIAIAIIDKVVIIIQHVIFI